MTKSELGTRDVYISCPKPLLCQGVAIERRLRKENMTTYRHIPSDAYDIGKIEASDTVMIVLSLSNTGLHMGMGVYHELKEAIRLHKWIVFVHNNVCYHYSALMFNYLGSSDYKRVVDVKLEPTYSTVPLLKFEERGDVPSFNDVFSMPEEEFESEGCDNDVETKAYHNAIHVSQRVGRTMRVIPDPKFPLLKEVHAQVKEKELDKYYYLC